MFERMLTRDRVLSGRYRVGTEIGHGGMATVYLGTDAVLGRTVAVKVLHPEHASDPSFVDRFRREARAAARLNHPNVVSVFDTGSDRDVHFIVMERIRGRTLAQVVAEEGPLPPHRAAAIARSVAEALAFAHANGLVHRDVKPANVMLADDGRVKVMDFGIARVTSAATLTQTATVLGTAAYLSPEQAQGLRVDGRSDVYALGVVLYEMLTGRAPFVAASPVAVAFQHVREEPPPPSRIRRGIPPGLEAVVVRALAKDPDDRFAGADRMAAALAPFAAGAPAPASSSPPAAPVTEAIGPDPTAPLPLTEVPRGRRGSRARSGPAHAAPRRRRRWAALVALPALAVLLAVAATLPGILAGGHDRPEGRHNTPPAPADHGAHAPPQSPSPSPPVTPSASPTPQVPTVQAAVAAITSAAGQAVAAGDLGDHAAHDLQSGVEAAVRHYAEGDLEKALEDVGKARERLSKDAEHGDASAAAAAAIDPRLADLAAAMQASPPSEGGNQDGDAGGPGGNQRD
jgi:eukaryotic-like serine/threonine-protein kinase